MKKMFFAIVMMVVSSIVSTSCSSDTVKTQKEVENIDFAALKLDFRKKITSLEDKFADEAKSRDLVSKYVGVRKISRISQKSGFNQDLEIKIALAPHYTAEEKVFMLGFYNELANCYDDKILDLLNKKRTQLNSGYFSSDFKNEVDFIFYTVEESTNKIFKLTHNKGGIASKSYGSGFLECINKKVPGKDLGRNMVWGISTGVVGGAYAGATAGTFTVPILGTAVGAVGGAVFGAAAGAVSGVVGGYVWPAIDCISILMKYEEKYLTDEFFEDEMPYFDLDREEMERFNDLLNVPVTSEVKIIEL